MVDMVKVEVGIHVGAKTHYSGPRRYPYVRQQRQKSAETRASAACAALHDVVIPVGDLIVGKD